MGKDYNDNSDENNKIKGVMDGAPAYQADTYLCVVPDAVKKDDIGEEDSARMIWETGDKTIEDYLALPEERRVELIDGVFYDMEAPSYVHQIIALKIHQIYLYVVPDAVKKDDIGEEDSAEIIWETGDNTIEDYYALPDERRVELIDGVFYDMAAPSYVHQNISGMIYHILMRHVEKNKGSCMPFISPADVQLFGDDKTMVQPDVFVVCNRDQITYTRLVNAPDLVIEVISPSTRRKDMDLKLRRYREAGVREYWIVFSEEKQVWVYLFGEKDTGSEAHRVYTFADKVPVGIWGGECEVDFAEIDERCLLLYE